MEDLFVGIIATLLSTIIIGLYGVLIIAPYNAHREIYRKILRVIRNYEDPRTFKEQFLPESIMVDCIKKQVDSIYDILDLIEEQKDLNKLVYKIFKYKRTAENLSLLNNYISNPVLLKDQKEFEDNCILDSSKFLPRLKKEAKLPVGRLAIFFFIPTVLLIAIVVVAIYLVIK